MKSHRPTDRTANVGAALQYFEDAHSAEIAVEDRRKSRIEAADQARRERAAKHAAKVARRQAVGQRIADAMPSPLQAAAGFTAVLLAAGALAKRSHHIDVEQKLSQPTAKIEHALDAGNINPQDVIVLNAPSTELAYDVASDFSNGEGDVLALVDQITAQNEGNEVAAGKCFILSRADVGESVIKAQEARIAAHPELNTPAGPAAPQE